MYYQNYEDYMRCVLGYPMENQNTYEPYNYNTMPYDNYTMLNNQDLADLYPDIYKLINPMVCKICEVNTKPITKELLDQMTNEIYLNLENVPEVDTVVNVRVNTPKENKESTTKNSSLISSSSSKSVSSHNRKEADVKESKINRENREDRQRIPNRTLQDLIRILILNQLIGGNRPPVRPPYRPPFPGGPGGPGPRPPIRPPFPRDNRPYTDDYLKF